eukprot:403360635
MREGACADVCRFCYESQESEYNYINNNSYQQRKETVIANALIAPCECKGSIKYIHKKCLKKWVTKSHQLNTKCSICQSTYASRDITRKLHLIILKLIKLIYKKREIILRDFSFFTLAFLLLFGTFYYLYKYQQVEKDSQAFNIVLTFFVSRITTLEIIRAFKKRAQKVKYYLNNIIYKKVYINKEEIYELQNELLARQLQNQDQMDEKIYSE